LPNKPASQANDGIRSSKMFLNLCAQKLRNLFKALSGNFASFIDCCLQKKFLIFRWEAALSFSFSGSNNETI